MCNEIDKMAKFSFAIFFWSSSQSILQDRLTAFEAELVPLVAPGYHFLSCVDRLATLGTLRLLDHFEWHLGAHDVENTSLYIVKTISNGYAQKY